MKNEIRLKKHKVNLENQNIIELAYLTMEMLEVFSESRGKLFFEQANCYVGCFYTCQRLLKAVDPEYLEQHPKIAHFFKEGRHLSNDSDRLSWEPEGCTHAREGIPVSKSCSFF